MMKIGVSSYSFARYLREKRLDLLGVIAATAQLGFDGIEFAGIGVPAASPEALSLAGKIRDACREAALPIFSYTIGADFLAAPSWQAEVERLKGEVKVAAALGVSCMRHDATGGFPEGHKGPNDFSAALPILADACRAVAQFAADFGIKTMVENHGYFVQDSVRCEQLVRTVDHPNFGSLIDLGNFACVDEDSVAAVTRMAPYAFHVHAKDFHRKSSAAWPDPGAGWFKSRGGNYLRGAIIGHGDVRVSECVRAIQAAGYQGPMSIEFEGLEDNLQALEIGLANLRRFVGN